MQPTITVTDLRRVLATADRFAARFCRQHAEPLLDQDDVRQDLLLDLMVRMRSFDPARSSLPTFAGICFQHRATRLGVVVRRDRRARHSASLDVVLPGHTELTLLDILAEDEGYAAWIGQPTDGLAQRVRDLDLDRALSALGPEIVPLCAALLEDGQGRGWARAGLSRTTFHRRVKDLRCRLLAVGIGGQRETTSRVVG